MIVPDFAGTYSALDAHPRPTITIAEAVAFMHDAGEPVEPVRVAMALHEMQQHGSVWSLHMGDAPPRYVLRGRLKFRRALRMSNPEGELPWGA